MGSMAIDSVQAIKELEKLCIETAMIVGDNKRPAEAMLGNWV